MSKLIYGQSVFDESIKRFKYLYEQEHRVIVSFSAGKDSGVCLELAIIAAGETGNLPVEVIMRDEEIMFPGTFEYAERVYKHKDKVNFHWVVANQPIINIFNRECPYWWVFDPLLSPEDWVREPPTFADKIDSLNIELMANSDRFPPKEGKFLVHVIGLRTQESRRRAWAISSMKSFFTRPYGKHKNEVNANPIYDWTDHDVWKAISDNEWDYNHAYDAMYRLGMPPSRLRIAPPTITKASAFGLKVARKAWPQWFEKVAKRLPGVRAVARFGTSVIEPHRRLNETWENCFKRECIENAPRWIAERSVKMMNIMLSRHKHHSSTPFPEISPCPVCTSPGSWKDLAMMMYMGNPFCIGGASESLPYVEPEQFRKGAGFWNGKPTW